MFSVERSKIKLAAAGKRVPLEPPKTIQTKVGEWSLIVAGVNASILTVTGLVVAILWTIQNMRQHPAMVISAWSGGMLVLSLVVFGVLLWIDRQNEEDDEDGEEIDAK